VLVGEIGGYLAHRRQLHAAFLLSACSPLLSLVMSTFFVHEAPARGDRGSFRETWRALPFAPPERATGLGGGFVFFWTFSPSFGPAFLFYQTDTLHFDQQFIGHLGALSSLA